MYMCNVRPAQTFLPLTLGTLEETVGLAVLTWAVSTRNTNVVTGMLVLAGAGTGSRFMPASLHMAGVWPERIASAMSLMRFAMPFGGTLGLTIMGSVFNNKFDRVSALAGLGGNLSVHDTQSLGAIADLPPAVQEIVRNAGKDAVMWAFISIMPIIAISLVSGMFLGNVWIKPTGETGQQERRVEEGQEKNKSEGNDVGDDDGSKTSEVIYVSYLYALFKVCLNLQLQLQPPEADDSMSFIQGNVSSYKHVSRPRRQSERT
jgi:hypothetical protein